MESNTMFYPVILTDPHSSAKGDLMYELVRNQEYSTASIAITTRPLKLCDNNSLIHVTEKEFTLLAEAGAALNPHRTIFFLEAEALSLQIKSTIFILLPMEAKTAKTYKKECAHPCIIVGICDNPDSLHNDLPSDAKGAAARISFMKYVTEVTSVSDHLLINDEHTLPAFIDILHNIAAENRMKHNRAC